MSRLSGVGGHQPSLSVSSDDQQTSPASPSADDITISNAPVSAQEIRHSSGSASTAMRRSDSSQNISASISTDVGPSAGNADNDNVGAATSPERQSVSGETSSLHQSAPATLEPRETPAGNAVAIDIAVEETAPDQTTATQDKIAAEAAQRAETAIAAIRNTATPSPARGPGGCCRCFAPLRQNLMAGLSQTVATAFTFGTKPWVELAFRSALEGFRVPEGVTNAATATVGNFYVAGIHTFGSDLTKGIINSAAAISTYRPNGHALLGEILTIDLPVIGSFVGTYALRGMLMDGNASSLLDAVSKTVASTSGGFVQGAVTDALRQTLAANNKLYDKVPPKKLPEGYLKFFIDTLKENFNIKKMSAYRLGHDLIGKAIGAFVGGVLLPFLLNRIATTDPAGKGAVNMTAYLGAWFACIHLFAFLIPLIAKMKSHDQSDQSQNQQNTATANAGNAATANAGNAATDNGIDDIDTDIVSNAATYYSSVIIEELDRVDGSTDVNADGAAENSSTADGNNA